MDTDGVGVRACVGVGAFWERSMRKKETYVMLKTIKNLN